MKFVCERTGPFCSKIVLNYSILEHFERKEKSRKMIYYRCICS